MRTSFFSTLVILIFILPALNGIESGSPFHRLEGKWTGSGWAELPFMSFSVDLEGTAEFQFDSLCNCFITRLNSTRLLMPYSDSGQIYHNPQNDSLFWKIKDNFGRHTEVAARLVLSNPDRFIVVEKEGRNIDSTIVNFKNDNSVLIIWKKADKNGKSLEKGRVNLTRSE